MRDRANISARSEQLVLSVLRILFSFLFASLLSMFNVSLSRRVINLCTSSQKRTFFTTREGLLIAPLRGWIIQGRGFLSAYRPINRMLFHLQRAQMWVRIRSLTLGTLFDSSQMGGVAEDESIRPVFSTVVVIVIESRQMALPSYSRRLMI